MTKIISTEAMGRLKINKLPGTDLCELCIKKGKKTTVVLITEIEAKALADHLDLLIENE